MLSVMGVQEFKLHELPKWLKGIPKQLGSDPNDVRQGEYSCHWVQLPAIIPPGLVMVLRFWVSLQKAFLSFSYTEWKMGIIERTKGR